MNIKHRAYALTEILVIIVIIVVLMTLSVRPMRTMISEIPRSARVCQSLNATTAALGQIQDDNPFPRPESIRHPIYVETAACKNRNPSLESG